MNDNVKAAAVLAVALVAALGLYLYFSSYHSCVRALVAAEHKSADAALACLHGVEPEDDGHSTRQTTAHALRSGRP